MVILRSRRLAALEAVFQSQFAGGIGAGFPAPLKFPGSGQVHLLVDPGSSGAGSGKKSLWHFGQVPSERT